MYNFLTWADGRRLLRCLASLPIAGTLSRASTLALLGVVILGLGTAPLAAQSDAVLAAGNGIGRLNVTPAATLLLPYFEVSGNHVDGFTPTFEVTLVNTVDTPSLAHVTLWTDMSVPTLTFDIYLTGYDVETFDLNALFTDGTLPITTADGIPGDFSEPNVDFPGCDTLLPVAALPASVVDYLRMAHSGQAIPAGFDGAGFCAANSFGDGLFRGYLTIDAVSQCTMDTPADAGYFADDGQGIATNANVLTGQVVRRDLLSARASADLLVHIEARGSVASGFWADGDPTFYGRYVAGSAVDNREPLATTWAGRYWDGAPMRGTAVTTDLICWRDSGIVQQPFDCLEAPEIFPLDTGELIAFNEEEDLTTLLPEFCSWDASRVAVADLGVPFFAGWLYLELGTVGGPEVSQSFVGLIHAQAGSPSLEVALPATQLDSALAPLVLTIVEGDLLVDDFESGDFKRWDNIVPGVNP